MDIIRQTPKPMKGRPTLLTKDEEALIVATAEIKGAHSLPTTRKTLALKLNEVLVGVSGRNIEPPVKYDSKLRYAQRLIRRVNTTEQDAIGQKKRSNTGEIKVSGLSHKRAKQGCPRLSWIMFHKICGMLRCIQKSEASHNHNNQRIVIQDSTSQQQTPNINADITTLILYKPPPPPNLIRVKQEITIEEAKKSLTSLMQLPPDLEKIQPRPSQVWNCDEIGIDPNGKWTKIVCTYKYCVAEQIWKAQTGESTILVYSPIFYKSRRAVFHTPCRSASICNTNSRLIIWHSR